MMINMKTVLTTVIALFVAAGCASGPPNQAVTPTTVAASAPASAPAADTSTVARSDDQYQYIIGPGDTLDIFVWGYDDLTVSVPVRPDGKITTRLIEDMQASGKTPTTLARDIEAKYVTYVKNPTVSVTVDEFVGVPSQQIKVVGGGSQPKTVPYRDKMTVLDVMIEVGGLSKFSSGNKARLVRNVNGEQKSYRVKLHNLLKGGDISANRPVQPGDIIIIPESWF